MKMNKILSIILAVLLVLPVFPVLSANAADDSASTLTADYLDEKAQAAGLTGWTAHCDSSDYKFSIQYNTDPYSENKVARLIRTTDTSGFAQIGYNLDETAYAALKAAGTVEFTADFYFAETPSGEMNLHRFAVGGKVVAFRAYKTYLRYTGSNYLLYPMGTELVDGTPNKSPIGLAANTHYTLTARFDLTKTTDNVTYFVNGEQIMFANASSASKVTEITETYSLNVDAATTASILFCGWRSTTLSVNGDVDNFKVKSGDNTILTLDFEDTTTVAVGDLAYGTEYTPFSSVNANKTLEPYVRSCWTPEDWYLGHHQYNSGIYDIYRGTVPVILTVLSLNKQTDAQTPTALYAINFNGADDISDQKNVELIMELLGMGYIVVIADFTESEDVLSPDLDWCIQAIRIALSGSTYLPFPHHAKDIYLVPEGYLVARNVMYYNFEDNAPKGTEEHVVDLYNGTKGDFVSSKGSKIPNPDETVTSFEECLKPDGSSIDLRLCMDIIYPATRKNAPVVMIASSSEEKMGVSAANKERPLDTGPLLRGCAVVVYDHCYVPMARTDHYGYFGSYGMNGQMGMASHAAAVRCVRYHADIYGYAKENYAGMGHSKGSHVLCLANPAPERLEEWSSFSTYGYTKGERYGEQPYLCYADGTPIPSGIDIVYSSMGDAANQKRNSLISEGSATLILACGLFDEYNSWGYWDAKLSEAEAMNLNYVPLAEYELGHDFPYLVDNYYNYDRYEAFMDVLMYNIKDNEPMQILYSSIVATEVVDRAFGENMGGDGKTVTIVDPHVSTLIGDATAVSADILGKVTGDITGKVVGTIKVTDRILNKNSGDSTVESNNQLYKATLTRGDELFVQFVGAVNESSVKQAMTLKDSAGNAVAGSLVGSCGGSRWTFVPDAALSAGTYTLTVKGNTVRALDNYDTVMVDGSSYTFTVE